MHSAFQGRSSSTGTDRTRAYCCYSVPISAIKLPTWSNGPPAYSLALRKSARRFSGCTSLRSRYPAVHRWIGRVYVTAAFLAGVGGLTFIVAKGTIGGATMDVGFGIYGVLTAAAAIETYRHARVRRLDIHRAWAMRLFALAIGSWRYRMEYGFWLLAGGVGHVNDFSGPFDKFMAFFFYVPNLFVAEALIRSRRTSMSTTAQWTASVAFNGATLFLLLGTYFFTKFYWGPAILARIGL
jgi:hypothetical protein